MPISITRLADTQLKWGAAAWEVDDSGAAQLVADIALGQIRYVNYVLVELGSDAPARQFGRLDAIDGARQLLSTANPEQPFHRDGWLFQTLSWIASRLTNPTALALPPHSRHAHKGFDSLEVQMSEDGAGISRIVIGEDKATINPRATIREDVWESIRLLEQGKRRNEVVADVSALLDPQTSIDDLDAIDRLIWQDTIAYRVAITVDSSRSPAMHAKRVFRGFENIVVGDDERREVAVLPLDDLREWMNGIAEEAIRYLDTVEENTSV